MKEVTRRYQYYEIYSAIISAPPYFHIQITHFIDGIIYLKRIYVVEKPEHVVPVHSSNHLCFLISIKEIIPEDEVKRRLKKKGFLRNIGL